MKTAEEFNKYYNKNLNGKLQELENERKKLLKITIMLGVGFVLGVVVVFSMFFLDLNMGLGIAIFFLEGALSSIFAIKFLKMKKSLKEKYKDEIIKEMVHFIDPSLAYISTSCISQQEFLNSKIFTNSISRYRGEDLVEGKIGKTDVRFSELKVLKNTSDDQGSKSQYIFNGIFFIADFNKDFVGETIVLPDTAEKSFGKLGTMFQKMNVSRPDLVKLENPDFEKAFVVYGTDQVEARYILTPTLMERILDFQKKSGKIYLSFLHSKVYIAISLNKNLFEPPLFRSMLNYNLVEDYFKYLKLAVNIVEDLDLNTRIWTKD